ncbi:MAG: SDR family NAD(P)-dependent oxidoreductase [Hyphomicrobiales bacterium]
MNRIDLEDQVAIVTGGAQGIGLAVAERMVRSGAQVALWDMDSALAEEAADDLRQFGDAVAVAVDITDPEGVGEAVAATENQLAPVTIAVNSAGIAGMNTTVDDYPVEEWQRVIEINLNGTFYVNKAVVPGMKKRGYGRIVNIASIAGKEGNPNASAYSASKAGVIALTKSLGKELANMDIAVNCVTPAAARTRIFDQMTEEHINYMLEKIPRSRFVEVEEVANMVAWMASSENSFTTGAVFDLSGGRATY